MSELEQQIREIDLICVDLHDRLVAIDSVENGTGVSLTESLMRIFNQVLSRSSKRTPFEQST